MNIKFMWEMTDSDLLRLASKDYPANGNDYCGSLFFGDFKVEFIWDECINWRINCFRYNFGNYGDINGVPYDQCDPIEYHFALPEITTLGKFTADVEEHIVDILETCCPSLIPYATKRTEPYKWYADKAINPHINIIHDYKEEKDMNRIEINYSHDHENDTKIIYSFDEKGSHLVATFTSEDPDYGTDALELNAEPAESLDEMANCWLEEISEYLDKTDDGIHRPGEAGQELEMCYGEYSNTTLFAVENALRVIVGKHADRTKHYMTIEEASRMVAKALLNDRTKTFAFCESDSEEAKGDPYAHRDEGGWHGIKRVDGFFDNDKEEFIVAVGHYGGGHCGFGYLDYDFDFEDCVRAVRKAICEGTEWDADNYIYIEEDN